MKEPLITISLQEYNEIKDIKSKFQKAFDGKKAILHLDSYFAGHSGYPVYKFTIVNMDKLTEQLNERIKLLESEKSKIWHELYELQNKPKKWWQL